MTWVALRSLRDRAFENAKRIQPQIPTRPLMLRGSLFFELDLSENLGSETVFEVGCLWEGHDHSCEISLKEGGIFVTLRLGDADDCVDKMDIPTEVIGRTVFLTLTWDVVAQSGFLALEAAKGTIVRKNSYISRLPLCSEMVRKIADGDFYGSQNVAWVAVSDEIEPICAFPTLTEGSNVRTPSGYVDVSDLQAGDLVWTSDHGPKPIRWILERTLPVVGALRPRRIYPPLYDVTQELTLGPSQRVLLECEDMEYVLGHASGLARIDEMAWASGGVVVKDCAVLRYYSLLFDDHEIIDVNGCLCESQYVGGMLRYKAFLPQTLYAQMPISYMPRHRKRARIALQRYELADIA
ncbi:MAG: Hint domain-containing protein [Halocynthiibacter sp.]